MGKSKKLLHEYTIEYINISFPFHCISGFKKAA